MYKEFNPPNDVIIGIRDSLSEPDLINISIPKNQIPNYPDKDWVKADFDDITVVPQKSYYIVVGTIGGDMLNRYSWCASGGDPYPAGNPWYSGDYGNSWGKTVGMDLCFITYGRNNQPPDAPDIDGEKGVVPLIEFDYYFSAIDPEGDNIRYHIDWGDGTSNTTGFYKSGETVTVGHIYYAIGTVFICAYAEDIYGATGPESTYMVEWKSKSFNSLLIRFLERFPIIKQLIFSL